MNDRSRYTGNRIWLMSSVSRHQYLLKRFSWLAVFLAAVATILLYRAYDLIPATILQGAESISEHSKQDHKTHNLTDWTVFQNRDGNISSTPGRFRLAGTFFEYMLNVNGAGDVRRAIIDDIKNNNQVIVCEGEKIDDIMILKIFRDHVIIKYSSGSEDQLWLTFSGRSLKSNAESLTNDANLAMASQLSDLDKFGGKQVGENKWIFNREKLLEYYKNLRDEPDRLLKVFDSLKPVYESGDRRISGYRLGVEGEHEFFKSVGLDEGDVVRSVNSIQMTSRRRAEYLISEFVADRANAFTIEIERGGKLEKLTYQIR